MEHRTLHQALRAASLNPLHVRSFIKLATGCGFLNTISDGITTGTSTPTSHADGPSATLFFPSPKAFGGVAALLANGHLCVFPHSHSTCGPEEAIRCALVEPLCVIILLFPDCFLELEASSVNGESVDATETLEDLLDGVPAPSLDTSLDLVVQPSTAMCATGPFSSLNGRNSSQTYSEDTYQELCSQRDSLALSLIADIDEQVRRGSSRLLTLQHIKAASSAPSKKYSAPSSRSVAANTTTTSSQAFHSTSTSGAIDSRDVLSSPHLGEGTMAGVQQRLSRLHLWKVLLLSCLASNAMAASKQLHQSGNFTSVPTRAHNVLEKMGNTGWARLPLRDWGWTTLNAAEHQYDEIVGELSTQIQSSSLITSNRVSAVNPFHISTPGNTQAFPFPSPILLMSSALAQPVVDISHTSFLGSSAPKLLFNESDGTFSSLLDSATQRKLTAQQFNQLSMLANESFSFSFTDNVRPPFPLVARQRITFSFLARGENASLLAERNRDVFVLLFKALSKTNLLVEQASQCRIKMICTLTTMGVTEPSCHIVKVLHDEKLINDSDLSTFVTGAVDEVATAQLSLSAQESQQRVQRSVTLLSLLLQNMFLANKRVVLVEPVDQVLIAFCLEHSKVRACSELYRTLMTLRGAKR